MSLFKQRGSALINLSPKKSNVDTKNCDFFIGFFRGGVPRGAGNWGTLRIPREDWGSLGNIRED